MLKIGLIGCGGMGSTHNKALKALSQDHAVAVVALADCRKDFLDKAKELWPEATTYSMGFDLIDKEEIDAVHICLPSYLHTDHAIQAMEKGLGVLIEKPVCITEEDCSRLLDAQKRTGAKVMIGQVLRFFEEYKYLKQITETDFYGKLQSIEMGRKGGDVLWGFEDWFHDEKKSGSVMLDLHVHDVDFLQYLLGIPSSISVKAEKLSTGLVNHVITSYQFGSVHATAEALWDVSPDVPFEAYFKASFERGTLQFSSKKKPTVMFESLEGETSFPLPLQENRSSKGSTEINIESIGPYYSEIKYFIECLSEGKPIGQATLADGIEAVRLVFKEQKFIEKQ
ncbi:putative dehydrogenase [Sphaerochaeta pleomorpha str. Grapes]|uniref:Putative dehydrogenase n=1 Tax=Sphaerochaeta pleomorpha (strain ATCC BAA-1885 / DSM 22778 / Grapes) TaxID=158190 RepID=G8QVS0_SPHPG|nr:Gfo/Idh/MocA family oxidoreductase [Sphaerochaeta pleomorpha]AEV29362.1 putative dehydrogenase [Sphaerochaeta pleomorpha str. Grapes]